MTDTDLKEIAARAVAAKNRADAASPGPWASYDLDTRLWVVEGPKYYSYPWEKNVVPLRFQGSQDADFIAAARMDVPVLAADVTALVKEVEHLRAVLRWVGERTSCWDNSPGNEPCWLNEDEDPEVWCVYHYLLENARFAVVRDDPTTPGSPEAPEGF